MPKFKNLSSRWILIPGSLIVAVFITYQNFISYEWELYFFSERYQQPYIIFFALRYLYFFAFIWVISWLHLYKIKTPVFINRFFYTFLISAAAYGIYVSLSFLSGFQFDFYIKTLLYQFLVIWILSAISGHVFYLTTEKQKKEIEIEQLKTENIQSRYVALTNQINPHFFFNSLNGLSSLIRKRNEKDALEYVNKLSDVFRYVLHSDKKNLATLEEELECVNALIYLMEVRFANKLEFSIRIPEESRQLLVPVLSLLPLIDNVVAHNIIDSEHKMDVNITVNENNELSVSNPIYPKLVAPDTYGTGLKNLESRFVLLTDRKIKITNDGKTFTVCIPLTKNQDENIDC